MPGEYPNGSPFGKYWFRGWSEHIWAGARLPGCAEHGHGVPAGIARSLGTSASANALTETPPAPRMGVEACELARSGSCSIPPDQLQARNRCAPAQRIIIASPATWGARCGPNWPSYPLPMPSDGHLAGSATGAGGSSAITRGVRGHGTAYSNRRVHNRKVTLPSMRDPALALPAAASKPTHP